MKNLDLYHNLADYIYKKSGILYTESDYFRLEARVTFLVKYFKLENESELDSKLKSNLSQSDVDVIINAATNNETYFFRDSKPFIALIKNIFPTFEGEPYISFWSAGCSTGQEIYSILMKTIETYGEDYLSRIKIEGSDISTDALNKAESGLYDSLEVQRGLPVKLLMSYFIQNADQSWTIQEKLREKITYFKFNLLTDQYPEEKHHVIFCRNVLIYQDKENKKKILEKFYQALKPGGVLVLGSGESLIGFETKFNQEMVENLIVFRKNK